MQVAKKFKRDMGDALYDKKIKEFAANKDVEAAVRLCTTCNQLQFDHKSGPCTRSEKTESVKYSSEEISYIIIAINKDVVSSIIDNAKTDFINDSENIKSTTSPSVIGSCDSDIQKNSDKLAEALSKIAIVLTQQQQVPHQVTKVKPPPTWAGESFDDYKAEVQAWEQAHPGETFTKYAEFLNELKRN